MKIKTTLFAVKHTYLLLFFSAYMFKQLAAQTNIQGGHFSALTLDYDNYIIPPVADYFMQGADAANIQIPQQGVDQVWDYSILEKNNSFNFSASYQHVGNSVFSNARRQRDFVFMLGGIIALQQTGYESDNNNTFCRAGRSLQLQKFPLQQLTGVESDSLIF